MESLHALPWALHAETCNTPCPHRSLCDALVIRSATKVTREVFEAAKVRGVRGDRTQEPSSPGPTDAPTAQPLRPLRRGGSRWWGARAWASTMWTSRVRGWGPGCGRHRPTYACCRAAYPLAPRPTAAASEYGCLVVNAPTANTVAAAEHGIALLCALARNVAQVCCYGQLWSLAGGLGYASLLPLAPHPRPPTPPHTSSSIGPWRPQADASMKEGRWDRTKYVGVSMVGKTLAVMGFGKVGAQGQRWCPACWACT